MGADPIVVAVSVASGEWMDFWSAKPKKSTAQDSGSKAIQEKGVRVVIVDDVCTTGASTMQAIEAAREFGFEVVGRGVPGGARGSRRASQRRESGRAGSIRFYIYRERCPARNTCCRTTKLLRECPRWAPAARFVDARRWCTARESAAKRIKTKSVVGPWPLVVGLSPGRVDRIAYGTSKTQTALD